MNRQEFEDTARRYREELFRMYASQNITPEPKPVQQAVPVQAAPAPQASPVSPDPTPPPAVSAPPRTPMPADLPPEQQTQPEQPQPPQEPAAEAIPEQPPAEPDTPECDSPECSRPESPKRAYTGIIRVHVSTARGARPVSGATVIITRVTSGDPELISLQTTNESGNIHPVTVAAPLPSADQRHPQSFLYDITAQASGYYREHSTDVPVFPNITSMQNFDLIPLPAGADEPVPDGDITFYNNMQQY